MKASLQLDPGLDVVANRLPNVFISRAKTGERVFVEQIERLAKGLDNAGALVIFPEGGNWTPGRWDRAIQRLERLGRRDLAARARQMTNMLAPQRGWFTAIEAPGGRCDLHWRTPTRSARYGRRRLEESPSQPDDRRSGGVCDRPGAAALTTSAAALALRLVEVITSGSAEPPGAAEHAADRS
jgi:hypothetical protein